MSVFEYDSLGSKQHINVSVAALVEQALLRGEGELASTGALVCNTGKFTGRSPRDRYFVRDAGVEDHIWWDGVNQGISAADAQGLVDKAVAFLADKTVFVRDAYVGAAAGYRLSLRVFNTWAWHNLFCHNLFLRVPASEQADFSPTFTVICVPEFVADPSTDGTRSSNFVIIDLTKKLVLIGGTGYAGEMKKSMFTVMNYLLPQTHGVLPMHCAANVSESGSVGLFFGLSGTGKTTLSADPTRRLIGDDEHGWSEDAVFNFEGGCYAKTIRLSAQYEPQIYHAIRFGAIVENTPFIGTSREVDYDSQVLTENTRTAYPLDHIANVVSPSIGGIPAHVFYLTADAFGVLPAISRLTPAQAMYHFISGYTAKVAGTEADVTEPQAVFSACFGAPFLPLHPMRYAEMLGQKLADHDTQVWLINTGWTGGPYGVGERIALPYTRALIQAALSGSLADVPYVQHPHFGLAMPTRCPSDVEVPDEVLDPRGLWANKTAYDTAALQLATLFHKNFEKYRLQDDDAILAGAPPAHNNGS